MPQKLIVTLLLAASLGGCSIFGGKDKTEASAEPPVDANRPSTKALLKGLPKGLIGDTDNVSYTNEELKGDGGRP